MTRFTVCLLGLLFAANAAAQTAAPAPPAPGAIPGPVEPAPVNAAPVNAAPVNAAPAPAAPAPAPPAPVNAAPASPEPPAVRYDAREDVRKFMQDMAARHGFERKELEEVFRRAQFQRSIIRAMTPPATAPQRSWQSYRSIFLRPERINAGVQFWARNAASLARASAEFGVPEEVIVAIIGIETIYGRNMGSYRVIDALTTLAFDFPKRAEYFRSELENFLLYTRDTRIDLFQLKGSYAGAIGMPQFMPGSYRRFAVDYDGNGVPELVSSAPDAIGSVGNFLRAHGWKRDEVSAVPAEVTGEEWRPLADAGIKPVFKAADLAQFGISPLERIDGETPVALVELQTPGDASQFWVGLQNFYAITRYNRSSFYAIAVIELSKAIKAAKQS
jgi:membrane-bound lytic murein transglycosylase B